MSETPLAYRFSECFRKLLPNIPKRREVQLMSMLRLMKRDPSRTCPYYTRGRKCRSGCWSEPHCITGQPHGGWPWERLLHRARLIGASRA